MSICRTSCAHFLCLFYPGAPGDSGKASGKCLWLSTFFILGVQLDPYSFCFPAVQGGAQNVGDSIKEGVSETGDRLKQGVRKIDREVS